MVPPFCGGMGVLGQTAPTLIVKSHGEALEQYYALILSGDRGRADLELVGKLLVQSAIKLASPGEVKQVTGFRIGSIPLIGLGLPCVLDRSLFRFDFVYGGMGEETITLKIEPATLAALNKVVAFLD